MSRILPQNARNVKRIILIIQYEMGGPRIQRGPGRIVEVQRDGISRPPKNPNPSIAYRWLMDNGYEPVQQEFKSLVGEIGGLNTFKPRRRQVYEKAASA